MTHDLATQDEELALIEVEARRSFNDTCYAAQVAWHNRNEQLHRTFQDGIEDNAEAYRRALTKAQRAYRDRTADTYGG